uniref:LID domain-containing protein n=1 Tax=Parastrongyloides trichosuri TaxID=131310 RepID=A0A0N5A308_PARTI
MPRKRATENGANGNGTAPKQTRNRKKKDTAANLPPTNNMIMGNVPNAYDHNGVAMQQQMNGPSHMMMMGHDDGSLMQQSYGMRMPPNNVGHMPPQQPDYYYSQNNAPVANGNHVPHQQQGPPQHHGMYGGMPGQGNQQSQYMDNERSQNSFMPPPPPMHQPSMNGANTNTNQQHQMMMRMPQVQPQMMPQQQQQHSGNMQQPQQQPPQIMGKQGRIVDMNNRLHTFSSTHIAECDKAQWWEAFSNEFFDNDAKFTLTFVEKGPLQYTIGRANIPRFFKRLFECSIRESFYVIQSQCKESPVNLSPHNPPIFMECDSVNYILKYSCTPAFEVHNNCKLMVEFGFDNMFGYRIRKWNLEMRRSKEITTNEYGVMQNYPPPYKPDHLMGIPIGALRLLEACVILEPMQALMHLTRSSNVVNPREALKHLSFQGYQKVHSHSGQMQQHPQMNMSMMNSMPSQQNMMLPPNPVEEVPVKPKQTRKRQRRNAATGAAGGGRATPAKKKNSNQNASPMPPNPPPNYIPQNHGYHPQGVMVVSEPSMMGKGYGENDERAITRIENTYYDNQGYQQNYSNMPSAVNGLPPSQQMPPSGPLHPQVVVSQSQQQQMHQIPSSLAQHLASNQPMNMGPTNNMLRT